MTIQVRSEENQMQTLLLGMFKGLDSGSDLGRLRAKAWDRFEELGLPTRRDEVFRYVPLRQLFAQEFSPAAEAGIDLEQISSFILPECTDSVIVFVNGCFQPALSSLKGVSTKVVLLPVEDAVHSYSGFLVNHWTKSLREETDPFAAMNAALHPGGAFLYVPPKVVEERPIQILHVAAANIPTIMMPRFHLFAGSQSDIRLAFSGASLGTAPAFCNSVVDMHLEEDAHVKFYQYIAIEEKEEWQFHAYRGALKRGSTLKMVGVTDGSKAVRSDYRIALNGEGAEALLNGLWMLSGKREAHYHILIDHQAPNCHSMQLFKGALAGTSRSSFEGKILVRQAAQKTDAFQLNNNLLLSERAHADSKPNLEIFADDVKASHGATVGQLDEEQLFYLKSRGFSSEEAKNLLIFGYCKEILEMIPIPSLINRIEGRARSFLIRE